MGKVLHFKQLQRTGKNFQPIRVRVLFLICCLLCVIGTYAQTVTSLISGNVSDGKDPIADAVITAVYMPTNTAYYAVSNDNGNYVINNVIAGGPYTIKVEKAGYQTTMVQNIYAPIAETIIANIVANKASIKLDEVAIYADPASSGMNIQRSGISTYLSSKSIEMMPTVSRTLNDILKLSPQASESIGGFSIGGGNYRGSTFSVDGASFNNAFGIGSNLPAGGSPISLDAIEQISINVTPFNVTQSGFQGGAVNMVTKRGTNTWHGSVYDYFTCSKLQGQKVDTNMLTTSSTLNNVIGMTLGGPIVKDKLFFFLNGEYVVDNQAGSSIQARPDADQPYGGSTGYNRPTIDQMEGIQQFLNDRFGYNPGRYQNYSIQTPDYKVLARLDWIINKNNILNFRFSHTHFSAANVLSSSMSPLGGTNTSFIASDGNTYQINRYAEGRTSLYAMPFESANYSQERNFTTAVAELNSRVLNNKGNNMARLAWSFQHEPRSYFGNEFPTVDILEPYYDNGERHYGMLTTFGPDPFTYANLCQVNTLTATDEFTYTTGMHNILAGVQFEWDHIVNGFMQGGAGWYIYDSWESFVNDATTGSALPVSFMITHANDNDPTQKTSPTFNYMQPSIYAQDEVEFSKFFKLTFGLRLEMPLYSFTNDNRNLDFDRVATINPQSSFAGLSTANLPNVSVNVSPRIGFNWDITKDRKLILRGGTGLFTGRIPNVWLVSSAVNSNCLQYQYIANINTGADMIHFNPNRAEIINSIYANKPFEQQNLPAPAYATLFASDLRMPTSWKTSLSLDIKLPGDIKATIEGVYSLNYNEVYAKTLGYKEDGVVQLPGEPDSRTHYTNENITNSTGTKMSGYYLCNVKDLHGQYISVSVQLQKSFKFGLDLAAMYTFNHATATFDGLNDQVSTIANTYTVNDCNKPEIGYTSYLSPHRVVGVIGYHIKEGEHTSTKLGLFYEGSRIGIYNNLLCNRSSYLINNVSGMGNSQLMYIPTQDELSNMPFESIENKEAFESYIASDNYLSKHRGEYSKRNARVAPWLNRINFRVSQEIYFNVAGQKHTLDIGLDLNNVGNLLCSKWGTYKKLDSEVVLNYDSKNSIYKFSQPTWSSYSNLLSTWQILFHIRYAF